MSTGGLRKHIAWLFAGNAGNQMLTFLAGVVLARLLVPSDFGMLVTVQVFTGIAGFIAAGGMGLALVRAKEISQAEINVIFTIQLLLGLLVFLGLYTVSPYFAGFYGNPVYAGLLQISALTFIVRPFISLPSSLLQRNMRFKAKAMIGMAVLTTSSLASISLAISGFGVWSLVWGGLAGSLVNALLHVHTAQWRPSLNFGFAQAAHLAKYGGMVTVNNVFDYLRNQTSNFLVSLYQTPMFLGLFNKADSLRGLPIPIISGAIYQVSFRALAKVQDNPPEAQRLFLRSLLLGTLYTLPIYVALWFCAHPFIGFVYGDKWVDCAPALSIMSITGLFMIVGNQSGAVLEAFNRLKEEMRLQMLTLSIQVGLLLFVLTQAASLEHVAMAVTGWIAFHSLGLLLLARNTLGLNWRRIGGAMAAPLAINLLLFCLAWVLDGALTAYKVETPFVYLLVFVPAILLAYPILAALLPFADTQAEIQHWHQKIKAFAK